MSEERNGYALLYNGAYMLLDHDRRFLVVPMRGMCLYGQDQTLRA